MLDYLKLLYYSIAVILQALKEKAMYTYFLSTLALQLNLILIKLINLILQKCNINYSLLHNNNIIYIYRLT